MQNAFGSSKSKDDVVNLSFYEDPPLSPISLESFEAYALDRLMGMIFITYNKFSFENY